MYRVGPVDIPPPGPVERPPPGPVERPPPGPVDRPPPGPVDKPPPGPVESPPPGPVDIPPSGPVESPPPGPVDAPPPGPVDIPPPGPVERPPPGPVLWFRLHIFRVLLSSPDSRFSVFAELVSEREKFRPVCNILEFFPSNTLAKIGNLWVTRSAGSVAGLPRRRLSCFVLRSSIL